MTSRNKIVTLLSLTILVILFLGRDYIKNYYEDNYESHPTPYSKGGLSNNGDARSMVQNFLGIVRFISSCKIFPKSIKDIYDEIPNPPDGCIPEVIPSKNPDFFKFRMSEVELKSYIPWIDPWGRPYQIRYDLERAKLQVRSQGRYLWTEIDDIAGETPFLGKDYPKDGLPLYIEMLELCKTVPKDDMSCIFNRGWH